MVKHNVVSFTNGLGEKLASRSRHVCLFLGAGASKSCGLPDIVGLTAAVEKSLGEEYQKIFKTMAEKRNLEGVLSRLRRIASLLEDEYDSVDGITREQAAHLDKEICIALIKALTEAEENLEPMNRLAWWLAHANYHQPIEVFTVNYDVLLERQLDLLGVPYFDGFMGTFEARFRADLVDSLDDSRQKTDLDSYLPAMFVRLWKLHGSLNWAWDDSPRPSIVRLGKTSHSAPAAIYPSDMKYDESRRMPFVVLQDRLRRALEQPETIMLISGYAFGDQHLNEIIFNAARNRPRSEFVIFCYSFIPEDIAQLAEITPNVQVVTQTEAVLSGVRAPWDEKAEDSELIMKKGKFQLGDFDALTSFLSRSSPVPETMLSNQTEASSVSTED